jgi:hypothetical protein
MGGFSNDTTLIIASNSCPAPRSMCAWPDPPWHPSVLAQTWSISSFTFNPSDRSSGASEQKRQGTPSSPASVGPPASFGGSTDGSVGAQARRPNMLSAARMRTREV